MCGQSLGKVSAGEPVVQAPAEGLTRIGLRGVYWSQREKLVSKGPLKAEGWVSYQLPLSLGGNQPDCKGWKRNSRWWLPQLLCSGDTTPSSPLPSLQWISCASFISHPFPQKCYLCMEEPPPFERRASRGPTCQLWAPDVLTESWHPPGCLPSPHLLPVMKTEGAACSDSG